jgi:hypothetical protein
MWLREEEHLLRADPVVGGLGGKDADGARAPPPRQHTQVKVSVELTQLTLVEVSHLQRLDVIERSALRR